MSTTRERVVASNGVWPNASTRSRIMLTHLCCAWVSGPALVAERGLQGFGETCGPAQRRGRETRAEREVFLLSYFGY